MHGNNLEPYGWDPFFEENFQQTARLGDFPARVISGHKELCRVQTGQGEIPASMCGRIRLEAEQGGNVPAVGDWVVCSQIKNQQGASILRVLPRKSKFSRKTAGRQSREQVVAANVDTVFLMTSLNQDLNLRRLERYLVLAWESGAQPVILLSKSDLCSAAGLETHLQEVETVACGLPVHPLSALQGQGLSAMESYLTPGRTAALLGSSGVGKSTLVNRLAGSELLRVNEVRQGDDRGRHTTSHRQLVLLPQGGLLLDTPGMRELQLWEGRQGLSETFEDVERLASRCRFRDCSHLHEPGCAVQQALDEGRIDDDRFASYLKLQRELDFAETRRDQKAALAEKQRVKRLHRRYNEIIRMRRRR